MAISKTHRFGRTNQRLLWGTLLAAAVLLAGGQFLSGQETAKPSLREPRLAQKNEPADRNDVQAYPVVAERLDQMVQDLQKKYAGKNDVRIAPNKRSSQIVVIAPAAVQREVAGLLAEAAPAPKPVEQRALPPEGERVRGTHPLRNVSARDFELAIARIWARRASFTTSNDRRSTRVKVPFGTDALVVLGIDHERDLVTIDMPRSAQASWRQVIAAIDSPRRAGGVQAELVALNKAEPAKIQRALELIRSVTEPVARGDGAKQHIGQFVSMIFQQEQPEEAQPAAAQPPAGQPPAERAPGEAPPAAEEDEDTGRIGPVQIEYIEGLDIFIIKGRKRDVERVQRIIAQIEAESEKTKPEVEVYLLEHVDDAAMSTMLNQIYTPALGARQGLVTIVPLGKPNALLLIGRREAIPPVIELIKKLDRPVAPDSMLRIFSLKNLSAIDAERTVRGFFTSRPGTEPAVRPGLGTRVLAIADYRSNSLIVQASPRDMEEIAQLLDALDVADGPVINEVRIFRLKNSLAEELAPVLQEAIYAQQLQAQISAAAGGAQQLQQQGQQGTGAAPGVGTPTQPRNTPRPTRLQFQSIGPEGVQLLESGILSDIRISADPRANALVVTGPRESMELMAKLIEQLDGLPAISAQVKVFTFVNADATQMATMLQNLFGQQQGAQQGPQGFQSATGAGENTLVPLRFSVDTRTNSIIASGNAGDLAVVNGILTRLDQGDLRGRLTTVYKLKNSQAESVATAVNTYLQNRQTLTQAAPTLISPVQALEQAVIVVPEPISNSLIVSAVPRFAEEIKGIVDQLDRRQNMVAIQVLIAEVALNDLEQFGVEIGLQDSLLFDRGIGTIGFPFNQAGVGNNSTPESLATRNAAVSQGLSNFGVGRTDATLGFGGLVLSASSDSVNVLVRALQQSQRLQILSRPQLQTLENNTASVQVGANVFYVTQTNITQGVVSNTVAPQQVGIILQITPRTNADGNIIMFVDAQKSELGPEEEGTPISVTPDGTVRVPQINITRASTTVNTRSGQTVILGGLITKSQSESTRRVPYLGDIPVLGRLFRFDAVDIQRTELLIIMTPYIIQTDEQQNWLNQRESERMSWCLADVVNIHGEVPYITGNALFDGHTSPLIFPDETPAGAEEVPPPPIRGISPPPMGPLPPATSRRNGPRLEPISMAPHLEPAPVADSNSPRQRGNPQLVAPPGAGVYGNAVPPMMPREEPIPAAQSRDVSTGAPQEPQARWAPSRPWQNMPGQLPPSPKLTPQEIQPTAYAPQEETAEDLEHQRIEPAVYR